MNFSSIAGTSINPSTSSGQVTEANPIQPCTNSNSTDGTDSIALSIAIQPDSPEHIATQLHVDPGIMSNRQMQVGLLPGDTDFTSNTLTQVGSPPGDTNFMCNMPMHIGLPPGNTDFTSNTPTLVGLPPGDTDFTSNTLMQVGSPEVNTVSDPMMQLVPDGGVGGVEAIEEPKVAVPR